MARSNLNLIRIQHTKRRKNIELCIPQKELRMNLLRIIYLFFLPEYRYLALSKLYLFEVIRSL